MVEPNSLIDIGKLAEPATVLIKKISNAIGAVYEPKRIVKRAEAEATANKIAALSDLEVSEIQQRGLARLIQNEGRKQQNIESIVAQSVNELPDDCNPSEMEEDWIAFFFEKCENVSDSEMQSMWAKLLTGEAKSPGSFSKRTVEVASLLEKKDAQLFNGFCQFLWTLEEGPFAFILGWGIPIVRQSGYDFMERMRLTDAGLVQPSGNNASSSHLRVTWNGLHRYVARYKNSRVALIEIENVKEKQSPANLGQYCLTNAGEELSRIASPQYNEKYFHDTLSYWKEQGIVVREVE